MTEQEWLTSQDAFLPQTMIALLTGGGRPGKKYSSYQAVIGGDRHLPARVTPRKFNLLACACLRLEWPLFTDPCARWAVETLERYADGEEARPALESALRACQDAVFTFPPRAGWSADAARLVLQEADDPRAALSAIASVSLKARADGGLVPLPCSHDPESPIVLAHCETITAFLRDIFGNPFRPVALDPAWRTPAVLSLAQAIYEDRAFEQLPILADALEEAGCASREVLDHCRGPGPHVRGCWVVDLVLGKG